MPSPCEGQALGDPWFYARAQVKDELLGTTVHQRVEPVLIVIVEGLVFVL